MKISTQNTYDENRFGSKHYLLSSSERMQPLSMSSFVMALFLRALLCIMILKGLIVHSLVMDDEVVSNDTKFVTRTSSTSHLPSIPHFLRSHSEMMSDRMLMNNKKDRRVMKYQDKYDEYDSDTVPHVVLRQSSHKVQDMERHLLSRRSIQNKRFLQDTCVKTELEFCTAILNAPDSPFVTRIDICVSTLNIDASCILNPTYQGINIQNKYLDIQCNTETPPCILDAQGLSRHFYVNQAIIKFRGFIFQNGNSRNESPGIDNKRDGGSLLLYKSTVLFDMCQFKDNYGSDGGAIASNSSSITFIGGIISNPTLFENNRASSVGGAIHAVGDNTIVTATSGNFVFSNNYAGNDDGNSGDGGAIYVEDGISSWSNGIFDRNSIISDAPPFDTFNAGGALFLRGGKASFKKITFQNSVGDVGGAIFAENIDIFFLDTTFSRNYAEQWGGAFDCKNCSAAFSMTSFLDNSVSSESEHGGGAVYAQNGQVSFTNVVFFDNHALRGAAMEASFITLLADKMTVGNNNSTNYGGFLIGKSDITIKNSEFDANFVTNSSIQSGSITIWDSNFAPSNNTFYKVQDAQCDTLVYNFLEEFVLEDLVEYRSTCVDFRTKVPLSNRRNLEAGHEIGNKLSRSLGRCVQSDRELRDAVRTCFPRVPCRIDVCKTPIRITRPASRVSENVTESGIDLSNKDIIMECVLPCPDRCILEGDGDSRLFYGSNSNATFRNLVFANGYDTKSGGSFKMVNQSIVSFFDCSFLNNSASMGGGAISVYDTVLRMDGKRTSLINNTGNGAPIQIFSSQFNLNYAVFDGNNVSELGGGIFSFNSTMEFGSLAFVQQSTNRRQRKLGSSDNFSCDMYMATNPNELQLNSSCISWEKTSEKSVGINNVAICTPTAAPRTAAPRTAAPRTASPMSRAPPKPTLPKPTLPKPSPPTPSPPTQTTPTQTTPTQTTPTQTTPTQTTPTQTTPTQTTPTQTTPTRPSCFSGWNIVEVKDVGSIRMDQLHIGDFVKSINGQFTQVYGFGHYDQALEEFFLQIHFDRHSNKQADIILPLPLEVSARHLVMLDKVGLQYPVRASDVVVGDIINGLRVKKIQNVIRRGVYAPLTQSGDLVVSGIRASNYVDVLDKNWGWDQHAIGHLMFFPQRIFCSYFIETCKKEGYINGYGYLSYLVVRVGSVINQVTSFASVSFPSLLLISFVVNGILGWFLFRFVSHLYFRRFQLRKM